MNNNNQQPEEDAAVLGSKQSHSCTRAVLGGLEGARRRLVDADSFEEKIQVIAAIAYQYNQLEEAKSKGVELVRQEIARKQELENRYCEKKKRLSHEVSCGRLSGANLMGQVYLLDAEENPLLRNAFENIFKVAQIFKVDDSYAAQRLKSALAQSFLPPGMSAGWVSEAEKATLLLITGELSKEELWEIRQSQAKRETQRQPSAKRGKQSEYLQGVDQLLKNKRRRFI